MPRSRHPQTRLRTRVYNTNIRLFSSDNPSMLPHIGLQGLVSGNEPDASLDDRLRDTTNACSTLYIASFYHTASMLTDGVSARGAAFPPVIRQGAQASNSELDHGVHADNDSIVAAVIRRTYFASVLPSSR